MKKISTFFKKDPNDLGKIINEINTDNDWVLGKNTISTRKFDGIACAIIEGELYKRYDVKKGKQVPEGAIACQGPDEFSGHHPHWVKCDRNNPADKVHFEAFDALENKEDATYELCGETISTERFTKNLNPEKVVGHKLIKHGSEILDITDFSYEGLRVFLEANDIEGIVFYNMADGRKCKLRKKDYGLKR